MVRVTVGWLIYCEICKCVRYVRTIAATVSRGFLTCGRPTVETKTVSISRDKCFEADGWAARRPDWAVKMECLCAGAPCRLWGPE